ncbi:acyl-CoA dehydrogenase family protein [Variovorax paradoxus]|uniref:acyl-CoA dehydrogenase family protein n=1 Tax=Variovorax paradoxus TaxID=34073 RepID=UPI00278A0F58|nr:acyl-CoA dehydrogenase family protein [Variovorax paradoxus]MDQ0590483.1 putative acyl-CoA dehydrogenase [Variovorax paradoxus]
MNMPLESTVPEFQSALGDGTDTHKVFNQADPCVGHNAFTGDVALRDLVARHAAWSMPNATALGALAGNEEVQELARLANEHSPQLRTHDRFGNRLDWVEFHPAWHRLMALGFAHGVPSLAWTTDEPSGHLARAVLSYLWNQVENGTGCPTGMAYAACAGFAGRPEFAMWREKTLSGHYDPRRLPLPQKTGAVIGYAMTEKQGGSDLRQTQTTATFAGTENGASIYSVTGHKWFFSVPTSDGFYTLARTTSGVSCLFVPRFLPDGSANRIAVQRLKDKCGNRSNASSEVEFNRTWAMLVGEEGRGIREILSHAHLTRLDFAVGSAGLMRQALTLAIHHASTRDGFGRRMADLPMQTNVLADLALESEAAMLSAMRVARATDSMASNESERLFARVATPVVKYWNCQRATYFVYEALQVHGGNGFIMENPIARLYREAPLNSIWEGTTNMMCMDVVRALGREKGALDVFLDEIAPPQNTDAAHVKFIASLRADLCGGAIDEGNARAVVTRMALALQASEMCRHSPGAIAQRFVASRLGGQHAGVMGTLGTGADLREIVARADVT